MIRTVSQAVTAFDKSTSTRLSRSTMKRQRIVLSRLTEGPSPVIAGNDYISRLSREHVDEVLYRSQQRRGHDDRPTITDATMNAYRSDLRRFGKWLAARDLTKKDVAAHLDNVKAKTPAYKRQPAPNDKVPELINVAWSRHPRDGMTALLMLGTAMRESEVIGLTWGDLKLAKGEARAYRPKIKDWHEALLTEDVTEELEKWQIYYQERHGPVNPKWFVVPALAHKSENPGYFQMDPEWPMVPTHKQTSVGLRVKSWLAAIGETDLRGRASHTLRRTAGNYALEKNPDADLRDIQEMYGHSSLHQTEQYLDKNAAKIRMRRNLRGHRIR